MCVQNFGGSRITEVVSAGRGRDRPADCASIILAVRVAKLNLQASGFVLINEMRLEVVPIHPCIHILNPSIEPIVMVENWLDAYPSECGLSALQSFSDMKTA